jgi:hypothetical protein
VAGKKYGAQAFTVAAFTMAMVDFVLQTAGFKLPGPRLSRPELSPFFKEEWVLQPFRTLLLRRSAGI